MQIESELKKNAERILSESGMTPDIAITLLYRYIVETGYFPPELKIPNEETCRVLEKSEQDIDLVEADSVEDLFSQLGMSEDKDT